MANRPWAGMNPNPAPAFGALQCPACWNGNAPSFMGGMGNRAWFRCRDCGMDFSLSQDDADNDILFDIHND